MAWQVVPRAPLVSALGSKDPRCKKSARFILILGYFKKWYKLVKIIENSLFSRKIYIIYQNVQKIVIFLLMLSSCMLTMIKIDAIGETLINPLCLIIELMQMLFIVP
jgi:hypothetical protein